MTTVKTQLGTSESARRERVEPTGGITATNVQKALEGLDAGKANVGAAPPTAASYVTAATETALPGSRRLAVSPALSLADGGAGAAMTFDIAALGVTTAKIAASAITYGKLQNEGAGTLLGNPTGAPAAPAEITLGATLAFSGSALQTAAHTGDVTTSANSFATTIANSAVSNAKMANMANQTLKANISGSAAAPSDSPVTAILDNVLSSTQGAMLYRGASSWTALSPGSNGQFLTSGGASANVSWTSVGAGVTSVGGVAGVITLGAGLAASGQNILIDPSYLQGYIAGLTLSNDGGSPNTVIDIAAGVCCSDDAATLMKTAAITKATGSWAVGSGNGGLDAGSVANSTWYHVFIIERTDTGVVDALISTSATSPTMPTNYTKKRRIGSFKTDGAAHILGFTQFGDEFMWGIPVQDVSATNPGTSAVTRTLTVPTGVIVNSRVSVRATISTEAATVDIYLSALANADVGAGPTAFNHTFGTNSNASWVSGSSNDYVLTNTGAQIRSRLGNSDANISFILVTLGWVDSRGRF